jgi:hypothetical protein
MQQECSQINATNASTQPCISRLQSVFIRCALGERKWIASPNLRVIKFVFYFSVSARQRVCSTSSSSFFSSRAPQVFPAVTHLSPHAAGWHWKNEDFTGECEGQGGLNHREHPPNISSHHARRLSGGWPHTGIAFFGEDAKDKERFCFVLPEIIMVIIRSQPSQVKLCNDACWKRLFRDFISIIIKLLST